MGEIEKILSQEKLQYYYNNNNINGAIEELSNFFEPDEFQEFKQYVQIKSGMQTYNNSEKEAKIDKMLTQARENKISFHKIICDYIENEEEFRNSYRSKFKRQYENN